MVLTVCNITVLNGLVGGVQWLSGRVIDSRPKGPGFQPHQHYCFVSLSKTQLSLLSTGATLDDRLDITERLLMGSKESNQRKKRKKVMLMPQINFNRQTVWTLIRLLLKEQSDLGPHCLQQSCFEWTSRLLADGI